ncbi:DUF2283 domain-containing protein [Candidatus Woesearchaeota archaeon]|nr:DUF2283 domain-containing protein [Candidatus Woesearchaeota archaeon]
MKEELSVYYDKEGDFLEVRIGGPTIAYFKDLGKDIFERIDEKTGEVRGISIVNFKKRIESLEPIKVSLERKAKLVAA